MATGLHPAAADADWSALVVPEDRAHYQSALAAATPAAPGYEVEYRTVHAVTAKPLWMLDRGEWQFDAAGKALGRRGAIVDITARSSVEREFRGAARLRQVVFEAARMAAWNLDARTGVFACTGELLALLGEERASFGGTLEEVERSIHPADIALWRNALAAALVPGGRLDVEFRVLTKSGAVRWLLARGETVPCATDAALESYGVMIDITERKSAEEAAARLAVIVSSSGDAIISKSLSGVVLSWNRGAERLFGYAAGEMIGHPMRRIIPHESQDEETRILDTIRRGEVIAPYESVRVGKDGRRIHVAVSVSPIRNAKGIVVGASTIAHDVTERRWQNELLGKNEARLRLALKSARAGAWDYDLTRRELHWSAEMFSLYGLDPAGGTPERESLTRQIVPSHRKRARIEFARAMLKGGSFTLEFPIIRPDGTEIWTALSGDVVQDGQGRPLSARGIDQDITERKSWEKRQALLLRELSHRVKNTLAVVQSIARRTLRSSPEPREFVEAFESRIRSLSVSQSLLTDADWRGASVEQVIRAQLAAMLEGFASRCHLRGPDVLLKAESATQIGLVIHELGSNACKHGAFSVPGGNVDVAWTASPKRLRLMWRETGGPPVPERTERMGFGTMLIQSSALSVERRFDRGGMVCKLQFAR